MSSKETDSPFGLTPAEKVIADLVRQKVPYENIEEQLVITNHTLKAHLRNIRNKILPYFTLPAGRKNLRLMIEDSEKIIHSHVLGAETPLSIKEVIHNPFLEQLYTDYRLRRLKLPIEQIREVSYLFEKSLINQGIFFGGRTGELAPSVKRYFNPITDKLIPSPGTSIVPPDIYLIVNVVRPSVEVFSPKLDRYVLGRKAQVVELT